MAERPLLNHVEMTYRPGDRAPARAFFEAMGFGVTEIPGGPWLSVAIDPEGVGGVENVMYANEPTPAQLNFEAALDEALAKDPRLADTLERYQRIRRAHPQYVFHFGASLPTHEQWQDRLGRLQDAAANDPLLRDRVEITVSEPGRPGGLGPLSQAFVHTDILSCGPAALAGVLFDLQWIPDLDFANQPEQEFPDMATMV